MANYYRNGVDVEPIEAIEIVCSGISGPSAFCIGNIIKYVMRAGKKDGIDASDDLSKARDYAHRLVYGSWPTDNYLDEKEIASQIVPF